MPYLFRTKPTRIITLCLIIILCIIFTIFEESFTLNANSNIPNAIAYDVIVVGSDPEGVTAATTAASYGKRVLLIDTRSKVGGLYTSGMLTMLDLNYTDKANKTFVNGGSFKNFYDAVGIHASVDIEDVENHFDTSLHNCGVVTHLNVSNIVPIVSDNIVTGVTYVKDGLNYTVTAPTTIDCIPDAPVARAAGASYYLGREDIGSEDYAAATLVFGVNNVDWQKVCRHMNQDGSIYTGFTQNTAWGFPEMLNYNPTFSDRFQVRALNLSLQTNGEVIINAFQIFNVDSLDKESQLLDYNLARKELAYIVKYMRANLPGFENATLGRIADEFYIREGVRIVGLQTLTGEDGFNNVNHYNKIAHGSYPMDLQSTKRDQYGGTILTSRNLYSIPLGIMIPKGIKGLLVASRSASYDSLIHSSARTVPVGMAVAEAAGVVAAHADTYNLTTYDIYNDLFETQAIQSLLVSRGVNLEHELPLIHPEENHWSYDAIVSLRKKALISKEYHNNNDYHPDALATVDEFNRIIGLAKANTPIPINKVTLFDNTQSVSHENLVSILNYILDTYIGVHPENLKEFVERGIISESTHQQILSSSTLVAGHVYLIMDNVIDYLNLIYSPVLGDKDTIIHNDVLDADIYQ